jgi:hypothetical protein
MLLVTHKSVPPLPHHSKAHACVWGGGLLEVQFGGGGMLEVHEGTNNLR